MTSSVSFDRVSDIYDATRGFPAGVSEQITDAILTLTSATPETQFLEPGVGTGRIALPLIQRGYRYTGVDISEEMLNELRQKLSDRPHAATLIKADATALPFERGCFDVILAVHLLHLIPEWQQALAEIRRVLKPGGVFLYSHSRVNAAQQGEASHSGESESGRAELDRRWRSILASYDYKLARYGATQPEVMEALTQQGATLETIEVARWRVEFTVGEWLDRYQNKVYSSCWQIPDKIFAPAIKDLQLWCQQRYSLAHLLPQEAQFKLTVVRDWAA